MGIRRTNNNNNSKYHKRYYASCNRVTVSFCNLSLFFSIAKYGMNFEKPKKQFLLQIGWMPPHRYKNGHFLVYVHKFVSLFGFRKSDNFLMMIERNSKRCNFQTGTNSKQLKILQIGDENTNICSSSWVHGHCPLDRDHFDQNNKRFSHRFYHQVQVCIIFVKNEKVFGENQLLFWTI